MIFISITALVFFIVSLQSYCQRNAKQNILIDMDVVLDAIRAQEIPLDLYESFREWETEEYSFYDYLCTYFITGEIEKKQMENESAVFSKYHKKEFEILKGYLYAIWEDLEYFPVPGSSTNASAGVTYGNSWMMERTFGGVRGHEGCDIMADMNLRGRYPVISMTDGVVEKIGWLPQGGYRLGIRAKHGGYFYYAHLYDYAKDFQPGDTVRAGEWIGFMGDSGYSEIEGTVGNFDVHLHFGIYVNQPDGTEISINSYYPLKYLEERKLEYVF